MIFVITKFNVGVMLWKINIFISMC